MTSRRQRSPLQDGPILQVPIRVCNGQLHRLMKSRLKSATTNAQNGSNAQTRTRSGISIPTCPPGTGYSMQYQQCIPVQQLGGTVPCSEDDQSFVGGRWVRNCR
jgi:hypothetical protein